MATNNFDYFYSRSKRLYAQNRFEECLESLKKAYDINPSEKLQIKINKLEDLINSTDTEITFKKDTNKIAINDKYYVDPVQFNKLYKHQQTGVSWLFDLFEKRKGGILGDDMGLGKTIQAIFFLRELFESKLIYTVLIVMPKSLLINWEREFRIWGPNLKVLTYFGNERERNLRKIKSRGGVLITTYNTIVYGWDALNQHGNNKFDVIILDEGHKIKNPSSKTCKSINAIRSDFRLILTGTAMQNNLKELWVLFDFIHQGALLGTYQTFRLEYEKPITDSRKKDSTSSIKALGIQIAKSLKNLISPYMLRRTKEQITNNICEEDLKKNFPKLTKKKELVLWVRLTEIQKICYEKFIQLDDVKALLTRSEVRSPLVELNILKKICDHPRLLPASYCEEMGMRFAETINDVTIELLLEESGKVSALWELLKLLIITEKEKDHRCLVFSQSKVVLTIIQKILYANRVVYLRLDGDIKTAVERQSLVDEFNKKNSSARVMLLTSQVGGVGLTLTSADRVIICDLSWNPAVDAQAVDRVYRIGQRRDVIVYRLVTCGTLEEKIYRRQIFKDGLNRQATGVGKTDDDPCRHFTESDLSQLFLLEDPAVSGTQKQLAEYEESAIKSISKLSLDPDSSNYQDILKAKQRIEYTPDLTRECNYMKQRNNLIYDIGQHDLLFSEKDHGDKSLDHESQMSVKARAMEAEQRLKMTTEIRKNDHDSDLSNSLKSLSLNESKWKSKINNPLTAVSGMKTLPELFIPSKIDSKRWQFSAPKSNIGDAKKQLLEQNISPEKVSHLEYTKNQEESAEEDDQSSSDSGEENEKSMIRINDSDVESSDSDVESTDSEVRVGKKEPSSDGFQNKNVIEISDDSDEEVNKSNRNELQLHRLKVDNSDDESKHSMNEEDHISSDSEEPGYDDSDSNIGDDDKADVSVQKKYQAINKITNESYVSKGNVNESNEYHSDANDSRILNTSGKNISENSSEVPKELKTADNLHIAENATDVLQKSYLDVDEPEKVAHESKKAEYESNDMANEESDESVNTSEIQTDSSDDTSKNASGEFVVDEPEKVAYESKAADESSDMANEESDESVNTSQIQIDSPDDTSKNASCESATKYANNDIKCYENTNLELPLSKMQVADFEGKENVVPDNEKNASSTMDYSDDDEEDESVLEESF